jgi:flagellar biosynthesis protein FlhA
MGGEVVRQLFGDARLLFLAAGVLVVLGAIPGMPNLAFLSMAGACGIGGWWVQRRRADAARLEQAAPAATAPADPRELSWEDVRPVDLVGIEVGYRLVPLVDKSQGGDLLARIRGVRRKLSQDLGFLIPAVHIRDNLELPPSGYRISLSGVPVGESTVHPDKELAINPGRVFGTLQGIEARDPAFGLPATWIDPSLREHAQALGFTVVDASTVVATHLSHLMQNHSHELLGHDDVQQLLATVAKTAPKLAEDIVPKVLPLAIVVKVLQALLAERVTIRNLRTILETLAEHGPRTQDPLVLAAQVRVALGRQIVQEIAGLTEDLPVLTLEPDIEQVLLGSLGQSSATPGLEPGLAERLQSRLAECVARQEAMGQPAVLLVPPALRATLARFLRAGLPQLHVLAWNEVPDSRRVRLVTTVGK